MMIAARWRFVPLVGMAANPVNRVQIHVSRQCHPSVAEGLAARHE